MESTYWKKCSSCKKGIPFSTKYYLCSVSTCQHKRKGFQFCSASCWDAHLGIIPHRDAWAEEAISPAKEALPPQRPPVKKVIQSAPAPVSNSNAQSPTETLVVVSKVKKLIKEQSGFNTSQCCIDALTRKLIEECQKGIEQARAAERKTVMGRDI